MPLQNVPRVHGDGPEVRCDTMTQMLEKPVLGCGDGDAGVGCACLRASLRTARLVAFEEALQRGSTTVGVTGRLVTAYCCV
jgi:hypothetical protein